MQLCPLFSTPACAKQRLVWTLEGVDAAWYLQSWWGPAPGGAALAEKTGMSWGGDVELLQGALLWIK